MDIKQKYAQARSSIKNGDIMLFRGTGWLAITIQYFDRNEQNQKAYYNHIGIVFESNGRLFVLDSNSRGVHPELLSDRVHGYKDFCIIRPRRDVDEISGALFLTFQKADEGIKYDYWMLPRIAIAKKFGVEIKKLGTDKKDICSEFVRRYTNFLGIDSYRQKGSWITPQMFIRLADNLEVEVLFNDSLVK